MNKMKTKLPASTTTVRYRIRVGNGISSWLAPEGYSRYHKRLAAKMELGTGEVYGLDQAIDHIKEVREKDCGEFTEYWHTVPLYIEKVTETVDVVYGSVQRKAAARG